MEYSFDSIKNEYGYIRHKNLLKYEEKKANIYKEYPRLKELDEAIISLYVKECLLDENGVAECEKKILAIKKEREDFLKGNNIKDGYLEVEYNCDKCKDTGFVDGKKCSCFIQREIELFENVGSFKDIVKKDNFENLNMSLYNQPVKTMDGMRDYKDYMQDAILHMKEQIKHIEEMPYNAIFIGATGTGKTFLAHCIGAEFIKKNKSVLCLNINEYLDSLKPDYNGENLSDYAVNCDLLILDDLGTENQTDFTNSKINYIVDKRLNGKSTIITTNLTPSELRSKYLESTSSRILSIYRKYLLNGNDLRRVIYANV